MRTYPILLACLLVGTSLCAQQQQKIVPPGFGLVPGNSKLTYPFGRQTAGIQVIIDAPWITPGTAMLTGMSLRPADTFTKTYIGYAKKYKVDVATTTVSAAGMSKSPATNLGAATLTNVFQGALSLPTYGPHTRVPDAFSISMPFLSPYTYASAQGSFLFSLETADSATAMGTWPIDSVNLRTSTIGGLAQKIGDGCVNNLDSLALSVNTANLVVGNSLDVSLTSTTAGAFPTAFVMFGLTPLDLDLSPIGMSGCRLLTGDSWGMSVSETAVGYPLAQVPIPNQPALEGASLIVQALGWRTQASFVGSVTSEAYGARIGAAAGPIVQGQCIFSRDLNSWYMASGSVFMPVVRLEGIIP